VGSARLGVKVELSDLETNQKIGESIFGTASSAKEGIFGGTTSRQIDAVSDSIVTMITSAANPPLHGDTPQAFYVLSKGSRKSWRKSDHGNPRWPMIRNSARSTDSAHGTNTVGLANDIVGLHFDFGYVH
jgi:hypothetical protein